jgi:predicted secreted protein
MLVSMRTALAFFALTLLPGCGFFYNPAGAFPPRTVTHENSGAGITLAHGQQLFVRLPLKAEPGYEWVLREPEVAAVKAEGAPDQDKEAGIELWTFTPVRDGEQTLRLEYRRPEDYLVAPAQSVSYNLTVEQKP